jgi:hypothetical protein
MPKDREVRRVDPVAAERECLRSISPLLRASMAEYRIYKVGLDGHFIGFEPLVCDDDEQAIEKAKQILDRHDFQIWSGPRFVGSVKQERGYAVKRNESL